MSNLEQYIQNLEKYVDEHDLSELEIIRYVYMDLGNRFSFNLKYAFGNSKTRQDIYKASKVPSVIEETMETGESLCTTFSLILTKILKSRGIQISSKVDPHNMRKCPHMYNIVTLQDGTTFRVDLQEDLENIQSHSFTKNFGLPIDNESGKGLPRKQIEEIDRKLGFVSDEKYYSDEYIYLLKQYMSFFPQLSEKVQFALENLEPYDNPEMKYAELRWHHEKLFKELFSDSELHRMKQIDCYRDIDGEREYTPGVVVTFPRSTDIYLYSAETCSYHKMTLQEFAEKINSGLSCKQKITGLNAELRKLKETDGR